MMECFMPDASATDKAEENFTERMEPLPSKRLRTVMATEKEGSIHPLMTWWRLQPGTFWQWSTIWLLINARYLPVYMFPLITGMLIDRIDPRQPELVLGFLPWALMATFGLCVLNVVTSTVSNIMRQRISRTLTAGLRRSLVQRLHRLTFSYHDKSRIGEVQNKFILDMQRLESLQLFISEGLMMAGTTICVMLVIVAWKNALLLIIIAAIVPLNMTLARILHGHLKRSYQDLRFAESNFLSQLSEILGGLRLNRAHATEDLAEERLANAADRVAAKGLRVDFITGVFGSSAWAVSACLQMVVVALGVWMAVSGPYVWHISSFTINMPLLSVGDLTVLLSYYAILSGCMSSLLGGLPVLAAARDAVESLAALWNQEDESDADKKILKTVKGELELYKVNFSYSESNPPSLKDLSLHIPAGSSMALVGSSGSGKSTVASLILGFYLAEKGKVLVDGVNICDLERRSLRRLMGVVSQDVVLFNDTILENIAWGYRHPDLNKAKEAAQRANALEFIEKLPGGFYHVLGDRGIGLSGGQRQRLAIARALYRDPRILILDEATSALDQESERLVQAALDELMKDRTTVIIAHRLSTVRNADRIAVLDHGQVVQCGAYQELISKEGPFRRLAEGQLG